MPLFKRNQLLLKTSNINSSNNLLSKKLGKYITMKLLDSNGRYENKLKNLRNAVSIDNLISGGKEFLYDQLNIFEENLKGYMRSELHNINPISCCNFINIHGTLNENIIIGIDKKILMKTIHYINSQKHIVYLN